MKQTNQAILFGIAFISAVLHHISEVYSANCASYSTETTCEEVSGCLWSSSSGCYCGSNVTMDICFALDSSGSIGVDYFQIELDWLSDFVQSSLSASARVGIINFSTKTYMILNFTDSESMSTSELADFIENDIDYQGDYTNTVGAIKQALVMFEKESNDETTKVFVIMTDGNPKMPNNGDTDVCAYASDLKSDDINTYILGVGSSWNPDNVDCLVDDTDSDIIYVTSFNYSEFDKILPQLTDVTCPVSYEVVITEVKVESDGQDGRTVPFIEIYNPSNEITLSDLTFAGVVSGSPTSDTSRTLPQGYYLVLYDASYSNGGENVTCDECDCTHLAGGDYCSKAVYIGCDGSDCDFLSSYSNTDWYVTVTDTSDGGSTELDSVTWDDTFPNLVNLTGYSYELKNKGYDNDAGSNWQASCNIYGSPGSEPMDTCTSTCSLALCTANGASEDNVSVDGDECDCDNAVHYYADGCSCKLVPPPDNCYVYWRKNRTHVGLDIDYKFIWDRADTDEDHKYRLCYEVSGSPQCVELYPRYKVVTDFDTSIGVDATAGTVQTVMNGVYSTKANCTSITQAPTEQPTPAPTNSPTSQPTGQPTQGPTYSNPYLFLAGDICDQDRCECYGYDLNCVGDNIYTQWSEGSTEYVTVVQRPIDFPYDTDIYWDIDYLGQTSTENETEIENEQGEDDDSNTQRRMIARRRNAMRRILSSNYNQDIEIDEIAYLSSSNLKTASVFASTVEPSTTVGDASGDISPTSGYVNVRIQYSDSAQTDISGNEGKIALSVLSDGDDSDSDYELFRLTLRNCSINSTEYRTCELVYPSELYIILENTNGAQTNVTEEEMPAWLWWVIVGLVIFLFILGWLVYRYWWKNKQTNSALAETQDELDQAIEDADLGFGRDLGQGDVGFNPLATGVPNANRPTDALGAELANRQNMIGNDKADVAVERFNQKEQFGQVAPSRRGGGGNNLTEPLL